MLLVLIKKEGIKKSETRWEVANRKFKTALVTHNVKVT